MKHTRIHFVFIFMLITLSCSDVARDTQPSGIIPPEVSKIVPAKDALDVSVGDPIVVFFSENISELSLTNATIEVDGGVAGQIERDIINKSLIFRPDQTFTYDKLYTVSVSFNNANAISEIDVVNFSWSFTTQSNPVPSSTFNANKLLIGLTSNYDKFISYQVFINSIILVYLNGNEIEILPFEIPAELANPDQLPELISTHNLSDGQIISVKIKINYSSANLLIEDSSGQSVPIAYIKDMNANLTSQFEFIANLSDKNPLILSNESIGFLDLDFDLNTSHIVELDTDPPGLTINPILQASTIIDTSKNYTARGLISNIDLSQKIVHLETRPYYSTFGNLDQLNNSSYYGSALLVMQDTTEYLSNDIFNTGTIGLAFLDSLPIDSPAISIGKLKENPVQFVVDQVFSGSNIHANGTDTIQGTVVSRSGNFIFLQGVTIISSDGNVTYNENAKVLLGPNTLVRKKTSPFKIHLIDDISIGQFIQAYGELSNLNIDLEMDATQSWILLLMTQIEGQLEQVQPGIITINLISINNRTISLFNFVGTGTSAENDINPNAYRVNSGGLNIDVSLGSIIKLGGFMNPYDNNIISDFIAVRVQQ